MKTTRCYGGHYWGCQAGSQSLRHTAPPPNRKLPLPSHNILGEVRALVAPPQVMPTCSLRPPWASGTQLHHTLILASLLLLTVGCPQSSRRSHCCPTFQSGRGRGGEHRESGRETELTMPERPVLGAWVGRAEFWELPQA